jgi:hypothetical protein
MPEFDNKDQLNLQKEIYIQTQNWARHNETLIIATNTVLLGAVAATAASFFNATTYYSINIFWFTFLIALTVVITTCYLSRQYKLAISRVVAYEKYFGMQENCDFMATLIKELFKQRPRVVGKWGGSFVPEYLHNPPVFGAASSWFFLMAHLIIFCGSGYKIFFG